MLDAEGVVIEKEEQEPVEETILDHPETNRDAKATGRVA